MRAFFISILLVSLSLLSADQLLFSDPESTGSPSLENHVCLWLDFPPCDAPSPLGDSHCKYVQPVGFEDDIWNILEPYFLPEIHPAKEALDSIFQKIRGLSSKKTMKKAGFNVLKHPQRDMVIARHPLIKGYLVKAYLDNKKIKEYEWWKRRIDGVRQIQQSIDRNNFNAIMKTPKKWIYPLPDDPSGSEKYTDSKKNFILLVEDMNILNRKKNLMVYRDQMTPSLLDAIFVILTENYLSDSFFPPNIPFSHDGKIAILDTEHYNRTSEPLKVWKLARYLSKEMRQYWDLLIEQYEFQEVP